MKKISHLFSNHCWLFVLLAAGHSAVTAQSLVASSRPSTHTASPSQYNTKVMLGHALKQLYQSRGIYFTYDEQTLSTRPVNPLDRVSGKIDALLDRMLEGSGLRFEKVNKHVYVIIDRKTEPVRETDPSTTGKQASAGNKSADAQPSANVAVEKRIAGIVTSTDNNEPLPGVSVSVKNTTVGTVTDVAGKYALNVPDDATTLVFSYIGYTSAEVAIGGRTEISLTLAPDIASLSEVVVVGYGERKKENYTGAVSTMNTKEIVQAPVANISNALTGRLSGLISVQRNGEPGQDGSQLLIRGVSTTGDNSPLVVVDGIPRGDFSQIDPNEIESLTLLKDPASAAVFGVRAANGVILITTKRGKAGKSSFSFSVRSDWQTPVRLPKYLGSYGYATMFNQALANDGKPAKFSQTELDAYKNGTDPNAYPDTDWVNELVGGYAPQQQYNLSLNGGTEKIRYFVSLGHVNQKGLYANSAFKRYNFRSNIDADVTATTRISLDLGGRSEDRNQAADGAGNLLYFAMFAPPIYPAYFTNGLPGAFPTGRNPIERARSGGYNKNISNTLLSTLTLNQQIPFVKGLSVKGVFAYDRTYNTGKSWRTPYKVYGYDPATQKYIPVNGEGINTVSLFQAFDQSASLTLEAHLNYGRTFGKHEVGGLVLYSQNKYTSDYFNGSRDNFISANLEQLLAGNPATQKINGGAFQSGRRSVVGRVNYAYAGRYLLEANFRYDGVSTFAPGKQFGFFPSISAGWKISDENFIRDNVAAIDYFKIRASYGVLGNDRIAAYRYLPTYGFGGGYVFGEGSDRRVYEGLYPSAAAAPNTTWETAKSLNIGFDGSILKRLLGFEFDWFYKRTSDILITPYLSVPQTFGQGLPTQNLGIVDNRGIELALTHENSIEIGTGLTYFVRANFTYAQNKLIFQDENPSVNPNTRVTGRSLNQFFGYQAIGLFQSQEEIDKAPKQQNAVKPGDIRYADINGRDADGNFTGQPDGKVDGDDQTAIGRSAIPQIIYGLSAGAKFKGFDLSFLFQGAGRVNTFITGELAWPFYNGSNALVAHQDNWTPTNTGAAYPRLTEQPQGNNLETSSFWLKDASYVRLKNLEFGYTLLGSLLSKVGVGSARVFVSGQNLLTFDKLKVIDPEGPGESGTNFSGGSSRGRFYPQQKVYAAGINVNF